MGVAYSTHEGSILTCEECGSLLNVSTYYPGGVTRVLCDRHAPPDVYAALRNLRSAVEEVAQAIHDMQKETVDMDGAVMAEVEVIKEHAGAGNSVRSVRAIRVPNMHKKERVYVVPINTEEASDGDQS